MARYMDTVDLWDHNTAYMVRTGQIKLQLVSGSSVGKKSPHVLSSWKTAASSLLLIRKTAAPVRGLKIFAEST